MEKDDKTEQPTGKKLRKARQKGEVPKSSFLAGTLVVIGGTTLLFFMRSLFFMAFRKSFFVTLSGIQIEGAFQRALYPLIFPTCSFLIVLSFIAFLAHFFQTGWVWKPKLFKAKGRRNGGRRFFFSFLQIGIIWIIGYIFIKQKKGFDASYSFFDRLFYLLYALGVCFLILGLCDFFYQKWLYLKKMRMSRSEKRDEIKENESGSYLKKKR